MSREEWRRQRGWSPLRTIGWSLSRESFPGQCFTPCMSLIATLPAWNAWKRVYVAASSSMPPLTRLLPPPPQRPLSLYVGHPARLTLACWLASHAIPGTSVSRHPESSLAQGLKASNTASKGADLRWGSPVSPEVT